MQALCTSFIKHVLNSEYSKLLVENNQPMARQLSVMLMIHRHNKFLMEETLSSLDEKYSTILSIVVENNLLLPEEEIAVNAAVDKLCEEGEAAAAAPAASASAPPTNVVAGIEPTTPRIKPKKKPLDE